MSSRRARSLLFIAVSVLALALGGAGLAGAASMESALAGALIPSQAPGLLGPITESGRKGWECKPEIAANARRAADADLPVAPLR